MKQPQKVGFWYSKDEPDLPMPRAYSKPWVGQKQFLGKLYSIEQKIGTQRSKGYSTCRICKCQNGSSEFYYKGWVWPEGFIHYVKIHNVRPPQDFVDFVIKN